MLDYRYDTQLLIEGNNLNEDEINNYFNQNFKGDCLLAVGDNELNTVPHLAKSMTLLLKTWTDNLED